MAETGGIVVNLGGSYAVSYFDWATSDVDDTQDPIRWAVKASQVSILKILMLDTIPQRKMTRVRNTCNIAGWRGMGDTAFAIRGF
jgi:hypothetical protein